MIDSGFQDVLGQATKMLNDSPFAALRDLRVEQEGELVLLRGRVDSFFLKQLAQETVRSATRGIEMINEVLVDDSSSHSSQ
jgi:osmotically-inducible protein OsmY